jgi:protein-disulfide isomerase
MSKDSKRSAREALAEQRRKDAESDRRRQRLLNVGIAVVVVAVVVGIFVAVQASRSKAPTDAALPAGVAGPGEGAAIGTGPVTVDLWEDFQCPACKSFEAANAEVLQQRVDDGDITLVFHPLSFLDGPTAVNNTSSIRAASAFGCAMDAGPDLALAFHNKLFEMQPPETPGQEAWSDDDLIGYGNDVGITGPTWESCVNDGTYEGWAEQVAASQVDAGINSTPTIFVDDEPAWQQGDSQAAAPFFQSGDALNEAIDAALPEQ